jgi:hypothetical protein
LTVERAHDWFKDMQEAFTGLDLNLPLLQNTLPYCSAFVRYIPSHIMLPMGIAGECTEPADSDSVVAHEYGHVLHMQII